MRKRNVPKKSSKKKDWVKIERKSGETTVTLTTSEGGMEKFVGGMSEGKIQKEKNQMGKALFDTTQDQ